LLIFISTTRNPFYTIPTAREFPSISYNQNDL